MMRACTWERSDSGGDGDGLAGDGDRTWLLCACAQHGKLAHGCAICFPCQQGGVACAVTAASKVSHAVRSGLQQCLTIFQGHTIITARDLASQMALRS